MNTLEYNLGMGWSCAVGV